MKFDEKEFDRQTKSYKMVQVPFAPPLNPEDEGLFDACLRGCKKLEEDQELKDILCRVYRGIE